MWGRSSPLCSGLTPRVVWQTGFCLDRSSVCFKHLPPEGSLSLCRLTFFLLVYKGQKWQHSPGTELSRSLGPLQSHLVKFGLDICIRAIGPLCPLLTLRIVLSHFASSSWSCVKVLFGRNSPGNPKLDEVTPRLLQPSIEALLPMLYNWPLV